MAKMIHALNTASGVVGLVPENYLTLPGLKEYLVEVDADTKSYEPTKYKAVTAEEYIAAHPKAKAKAADKAPAKDDKGRDLIDPFNPVETDPSLDAKP